MVGASMGDLGRHTYMFEGYLIYTPQVRVFQQVHPVGFLKWEGL